MNLWAYITDAWYTIISNKLRSGLSSLGIIIGISSVVIILSLGGSVENQLLNNLGSIAANSVTITPSNLDANPGALTLPMNNETINFLEQTFPILSGNILATQTSQTNIKYLSTSESVKVQGISKDYFAFSKSEFYYGQPMAATEFNDQSSSVVLSHSSLKDFFDNINPIGKLVTIKGKAYTVIGVLKESTAERMGMAGITAYLPNDIFYKDIVANHNYESINIYIPDGEDNETWRKVIYYTLLQHIGASHTKQANFDVSSTADFIEQIQSSLSIFSYFLAAIGGISLLVGGIGVMNIMIVSVTERTREIGIRKAIGALRKDIIMQFLVESIVITFLGGVVAILISYLLVGAINGILSLAKITSGPFVGFHVSIALNTILLAFTLTTIIGILFGISPAQKAAKLKPIDALRFE